MTIRCDIVTAEKTVFSEDVDYVSIPGIEGQFGVKPKHSAMLTVMRFGEVYLRQDGQEKYFAVGGGIVEVQPDKVIILADSADRAEEIDLEANEHEKLIEAGMVSLGSKVVSNNKRGLARIALDAVLSVADLTRKDVNFDLIKVIFLNYFNNLQ